MNVSRDNLRIVQATPADVQVASSILQEAARWLVDTGREMWYPYELTPEQLSPPAEAGELYLAKLDGVPVGTMIFQWDDQLFWPDVPAGESAFFHRLAVRRSVAGQGVSTAMIEWAKAMAAKAGKKYLRLDTDAIRPKLCAIYESFGFNLHSTRQMGRFSVARYEMRITPQGQ